MLPPKGCRMVAWKATSSPPGRTQAPLKPRPGQHWPAVSSSRPAPAPMPPALCPLAAGLSLARRPPVSLASFAQALGPFRQGPALLQARRLRPMGHGAQPSLHPA